MLQYVRVLYPRRVLRWRLIIHDGLPPPSLTTETTRLIRRLPRRIILFPRFLLSFLIILYSFSSLLLLLFLFFSPTQNTCQLTVHGPRSCAQNDSLGSRHLLKWILGVHTHFTRISSNNIPKYFLKYTLHNTAGTYPINCCK